MAEHGGVPRDPPTKHLVDPVAGWQLCGGGAHVAGLPSLVPLAPQAVSSWDPTLRHSLLPVNPSGWGGMPHHLR